MNKEEIKELEDKVNLEELAKKEMSAKANAVLKMFRSDYEMKKKKASKYMGIYNAMSEQQRWRGGDAILKKVELWQAKANAVLEILNPQKIEDTNNL